MKRRSFFALVCGGLAGLFGIKQSAPRLGWFRFNAILHRSRTSDGTYWYVLQGVEKDIAAQGLTREEAVGAFTKQVNRLAELDKVRGRPPLSGFAPCDTHWVKDYRKHMSYEQLKHDVYIYSMHYNCA
jgi:hypothetical protein